MSSALTNLVPVLKGPNYKTWFPLMQSFLMSQGQWRVTCKPPPTLIPAKPATETEEAVTGNQDDVDEWFNLNSKALGNIRLRLHHTIQYKHCAIKAAGKMLDKVETEYGKPGLISIYLELKGTFDTQIPANSNPTLALDKIISHFGRMAEAGTKVTVPDELQALIILAKMPSSMSMLTQMVSQQDKIDDLKLENVRRSIISSWEQTSRQRPQRNANAISGVQRGPRDTPFNQQQQYNSRGGRGGCRSRGQRGGQNKHGQQQQQQQQSNQADRNVASPSRLPLPQPPLFPPSHFSFGDMASPTDLPLPTSKYPTFNNALELTRKLGIRPSIETLKTLEYVEGKGKERELEVRLDPCICKHDLPRGKVQGQTSRAKRQRIVDPDKEVPWEWDEDAGALEWDEQDDVENPMGLCQGHSTLSSQRVLRVPG